tara:strand:+ start:11237 stop:11707 length:471 start_codon:yes stop_codon:yes gene_type:complete
MLFEEKITYVSLEEDVDDFFSAYSLIGNVYEYSKIRMKYLKEMFKLFHILSFSLLILFFSSSSVIAASTKNWTEIAATSDGIQFIDTQSIRYKKGILFILTKYSEINPENNDILSTKSYQMEIDCQKRLFKTDSSKNWEKPETKLMKAAIIKSCTY